MKTRTAPGLVVPAILAATACAQPVPPPPGPAVVDTVVVRDTVRFDTSSDLVGDLEEQLADLQIQYLASQQQVEDLGEELARTRQEVVRTMAKLQTEATRAEAASGMAEAEIALEALARSPGGTELPEHASASDRVSEATAAFNAGNYGGAVYLASQGRSIALAGQRRLREGQGAPLLPGESVFPVPLPLQTVSRSNVRGGPGLDHGVLFTLDGGLEIEAQSRVGQWLRVLDRQRREGWIYFTLVASR